MDKKPSWTAIIIWFIFFWPVAFYLLYKRYNNDNQNSVKKYNNITVSVDSSTSPNNDNVTLNDLKERLNGDMKKTLIICIVLGVIGVACIPVGIIGVVLGIGCIAGAVYLYTKKYNKKELYKKYLDIIFGMGVCKIDEIAKQVKITYEECTEDLTYMIEKNYMHTAIIDYPERRIILRKNDNVADTEIKKFEKRVVKCPSCGADNTIILGDACKCRYCSSLIEMLDG